MDNKYYFVNLVGNVSKTFQVTTTWQFSASPLTANKILRPSIPLSLLFSLCFSLHFPLFLYFFISFVSILFINVFNSIIGGNLLHLLNFDGDVQDRIKKDPLTPTIISGPLTNLSSFCNQVHTITIIILSFRNILIIIIRQF